MKYLHLACLLLLSACSGTQVENYQATTPALDLRNFLQGDLKAYGLLRNRAGEMTRRFVVDMHASWQGETGTLVEHFSFDDGEQQDRTWTLTHVGNGQYRGRAGDVVGEASGNTAGSVFQWQYQLEVPWGDGTIAVTLDDWLYLIDEQHLVNVTKLSKFGFKVGELTLIIEK